MYLGYDLCSTILIWMADPSPFFSQSFSKQVLFAWTKAFRAYYSFEFMYYICAALTVFLNFWTPCDWPPFTGSFRRDAWSIRNMWGKCWHQMARRECSEAGRIVKELFGFKTGTLMSKYSQVWAGFAMTILSHQAGAITGRFEDSGFWQMMYFAVQPLGIMFEDLITFLGRSVGIKAGSEFRPCHNFQQSLICDIVWTKRLGFLWVIAWFSVTIRFIVAYQPSSWHETYQAPSVIDFVFKSSGLDHQRFKF